MKLNPRYLHNIYCDDVRQEVNGKMSYIGVYDELMEIEGSDSISLPKLCVVSMFYTPKNAPVKSGKFLVKHNESIVHELDFDIPDDKEYEKQKDRFSYYGYGAIINLQPFSMLKGDVLRVCAIVDGEGFAGAALWSKRAEAT